VTDPLVVVHADAALLAAATAARLVTALADAQAARGSASVVLTGGRTGIAVLEQVRVAAARDAVDWSHVHFYWGDERFLPSGHPDRNETQARAALLDDLPVWPDHIHAMGSSDDGADPDAAAAAYAELLDRVPTFDVCLLGVGEEGHTLSVFPDSPAVHEKTRSVVAVRNCPKPPPTRISMTLATTRRSAEVWLMTTGQSKADPVRQALSGADEVDIPAAGARGTQKTLWLLDLDAAARIPF
jgi:6-phosphogluconolactonase